MGAYNEVEVYRGLLPRRYRKYKGWQTKDVVTPEVGQSHILIITNSGALIHKHTIYNYHVGKYDDGFPYLFTTVRDEGCELLKLTGKMRLYAGNNRDVNSRRWRLIELVAEFVDGKLVSIKEDG